MLFDIESFDYSYYNEGSEGLKLALVHHLDMPIMRQKGYDCFYHIRVGRGGVNLYLVVFFFLVFFYQTTETETEMLK